MLYHKHDNSTYPWSWGLPRCIITALMYRCITAHVRAVQGRCARHSSCHSALCSAVMLVPGHTQPAYFYNNHLRLSLHIPCIPSHTPTVVVQTDVRTLTKKHAYHCRCVDPGQCSDLVRCSSFPRAGFSTLRWCNQPCLPTQPLHRDPHHSSQDRQHRRLRRRMPPSCCGCMQAWNSLCCRGQPWPSNCPGIWSSGVELRRREQGS